MIAWFKRFAARRRRRAAPRGRPEWRRWLGRIEAARRRLRPLARWTWYGSAIVLVLIAVVFTGVRLYLPVLAERKTEFEDYLSRQAGYTVRMQALTAYWDGPNPGFRVSGLAVYSPTTQRPAVMLDEARITLAWLPLLRGRLTIASLVLAQPRLTIERLADGRFQVTGLRPFDEAADREAAEAPLTWLFAQSRLVIEDGELQWVDHRAGGDPLYLSGVNFSLHNSGRRHRLGLRARFPEDLCAECLVVADVRGNPFADALWRGDIYLRAIGLNTATLPAILRERLPAGLKGRADVNLLSRWERAQPTRIEGEVAVDGLAWPRTGAAPIAVRHLAGDVKWRGAREGRQWRLDLNDLSLGLTGSPWQAERLRLERRDEQFRLQVRNVELDDLAAFAETLPADSDLLRAVLAARPSGRIRDLKLRTTGEPDAPRDYTLSGELFDLRFAAQDRFPGVAGLSGRIEADAAAGELIIASPALHFDLPTIFTQPLALGGVQGRLSWERADGGWLLGAQALEIDAADGRAVTGLELRLPHDRARSPQLRLRIDFRDVDVAAARHYYPARLPPKLRAWLERAVVGGRVSEGHLIYTGPVRQFPFRAGEGKFEVMAHVQDGVFEYLPGWPAIENIDADLHFQGPGLDITVRSGSLHGLAVSRVAASIADMSPSAEGVVEVTGRIAGAAGDLLDALYVSDPPWLEFLPRGIAASGPAALSLDVRVPVHAPADTRVTGVVQLSDAALRLPGTEIAAQALNGELRFDERGPLDGEVGGRLFGGPATLSLSRGEREWLLRAGGGVTAAGLRPLIGAPGLAFVSGEAPWDAQLRIRPDGGSRAGLTADLTRMAIALPAPLDKPLDRPAGLRLDAVDLASGARRIDVRLDDVLGAVVELRHAPDDRWSLARGRIAVGEEPGLSDESGLHLSLREARLDADAWWRALKALVPADASSAWHQPLTRVSADVKALHGFNRELGAFSVELSRWPESWRGQVRGDAVDGAMLVTTESAAIGIELDLDRLQIPPPESGAAAERMDPRRLPRLRVSARRLQLAGREWGELELRGVPAPDGWRIESLGLRQAPHRVDASGRWRVLASGAQRTEINSSLHSPDLGGLLARLGYPDEMVGGVAHFELGGAWQGAPTEFGLARLDGELSVSIDEGRLVQVKQGTGRILGVLDLNSLTRYLALDFSNLFGKGFAFDSIKGQATVERGNAYTRNLSVKGPSAHLFLSGRVGLATQDLDLEVDVVPRFKEELAMTGLILGSPAVGAAVLAAQELFKKPLEQGARISYTVKGGWQEPVIVRVPKLTVINPGED
ncbi:MAG TPA: YhdP family protein [Acidiferrobacterales bacterium]